MRLVIVGKKQLNMLLVILVAVAVFAAAAISAGQRTRQLPIYSVENNDKQISLTFDAAWGADDTDEIIAILKKYKVQATFFVVGSWVDRFPDEVRKLHNAGHSIMNHSDAHPHINRMSVEEVVADAEACNRKIEAITGVKPIFYRAPYGEYNDQNVAAINAAGMQFIQWSADSIDWREEYTPERLLQNVLGQIDSGGIILCHNGAKHTLQELPMIIERLQSDGYKFVPLEQLIIKENYYIDNNGRQHSS